MSFSSGYRYDPTLPAGTIYSGSDSFGDRWSFYWPSYCNPCPLDVRRGRRSIGTGSRSYSGTTRYRSRSYSYYTNRWNDAPQPPPATLSATLRGDDTALQDNLTSATLASGGTVGCALYKFAMRPQASGTARWRVKVTGSGSWGIGVATELTNVNEEPGQGGNPGAVLYFEEGADLDVCVDDTCEAVAGSTPEVVDVCLTATAGSLAISWYGDGALLVGPKTLTFASLWCPVLVALDEDTSLQLTDWSYDL
jgi:hypothetical protein